jgi:hypothetical protein
VGAVSKLTKAARGMPCTIRVPGFCNANPETTVACHYRSVSLGAGMGIKTPDWLSAHGCSGCHDAVDGRVRTPFSRDELRLMHAEGVMRTQLALVERGAIHF